MVLKDALVLSELDQFSKILENRYVYLLSNNFRFRDELIMLKLKGSGTTVHTHKNVHGKIY